MEQGNWEEQIKRSQAGDRQAQEKLVLAVQDRVYYHCHKMLKNPEDAKDATQEILISMLSGLKSLRQPAAFWAWLNRITSNTCCRWLSSVRQQPVQWSGEDAAVPLEAVENLDDQAVPDKALDNEETRRMVVELVEALPEAQRLSVLFYYYDEMSVREIAEAMETSESTVKSRLYYAREAIRKGVERYAGEGFKLYGLTPVPFLRYFLQKETASTAAALAGKAALAATAGTAAAVGKTAVSAALSKAVSGILAHKGLAAVAGLALAGAIAGGSVLRQPPAPAAEEPPKALTQTVPYPPETTAPPPPAPEQAPEQPTAEPLLTTPAWMGDSPAPSPLPDGPGPLPQEPEDLPPQEQPEDLIVPEEEEAGSEETEGPEDTEEPPEAEEPKIEPEESQPEPESEETAPTPERDADRDERDDDEDRRPTRPDPDPDPDPDPPEVPIPPAESVQYLPDPDFGDYLGETEEGVHEFLYTSRLPDTNASLFPLKKGSFFSRLEIANPMVVRTEGPYIFGVDVGETDVRYYVSEKEEGPYILKALVHVQVLRQPTEPGDGYQLAGTEGDENGPLLLTRRFCADGKDQPQPLVFKGYEMKLESETPAVLGVRGETNAFYGIAPGTAEGRVYLRISDRFPWNLAARVLFEIDPVPSAVGLCRPRTDFSPENGAEGALEAAYQGTNAQGLYDFTASVREGGVFRLQPLLEGTHAIEWELSSAAVGLEASPENTFRALEAGSTDITCRVRPEGESVFAPCAVIHVKVLPQHPPYLPNPDFGQCLGRDEQEVWHFKAELRTDGPSLPSALAEGNYFLRIISADSQIAAVRDGRLYGVTPGSVEVRYYVSETEDAGYQLQAIASVEVVSPEPEPPEEEEPLIPPGAEVIHLDANPFGYRNGYGYNYTFPYNWELLGGEELPSGLVYRSSDPEVVVIHETGDFTTLSAGTAVLAAWDPADPSVCYTMSFQVEDHFDWNVYLGPLDTLTAGVESSAYISGFSKDYSSKLLSVEWASSDPELLRVTPFEGDYLNCHLLGLAPGTAAVTGTARFSLVTAADKLTEMTDTFTFQVEILPAPEPSGADETRPPLSVSDPQEEPDFPA